MGWLIQTAILMIIGWSIISSEL